MNNSEEVGKKRNADAMMSACVSTASDGVSTAKDQPWTLLDQVLLLTHLLAGQNNQITEQRKEIDELKRVVASEPAAKRPRWQKQVSSIDLMAVQTRIIKLEQQFNAFKAGRSKRREITGFQSGEQ